MEEGRKSDLKGEQAEELVIQKDKPTEQQATQPVPGISEVEEARGDNHSKPNPDTSPLRVNANAQPVLEQTRKHAPITTNLHALAVDESKNNRLSTNLASDQELSECKAKLASKEEELKAAKACFETLENQFNSLTKEVRGFYSAGVIDDIRERLEDIVATIRTETTGLEVPDKNSSVKGKKSSEAEPSQTVSFTNFPKRREDFPPENSPVKAKKAKLSVLGRFVDYIGFSKILKTGESSSQPNSQLRALARTTLRQNNIIFSKLDRLQLASSSSSRSHPISASSFEPPPTTANNIPLIFLYTANTVLFLAFLVAIAWALAAGFMADRERKMWLAGGETARAASVLLERGGGFWEKGWGPGAGGWGLGGDVEGLSRGYF